MEAQSNQILSLSSTLTIHPSYSPYCIITSPQSFSPTKQSLTLYLQIKPLQTLRINSLRPLIILNLSSLSIHLQLEKNEKQFLFKQGKYANYVSIWISYNGKKQKIGSKKVNKNKWTSLSVTIDQQVQVAGNKFKLEGCVPVLQIGSTKANGAIFQLRKLSLGTNKPDNKLEEYQIQTQIEEGPLNTMPNTPIPSLETLSSYISPTPPSPKLYLCHDMQGGYNQDINLYNPYPTTQHAHTQPQTNLNILSNKYRSLHIPQTEIFNYFSHYLITIPPLHWRRLCRRNGTKCLGTYIVEGNVKEQEYLSQYSVDLLVYLAKMYQFDGYLINFEQSIKNPRKVQPWLNSLIAKIHEAIPGSHISWYDSVTLQGKVSYQNQLNLINSPFYKICDSIFLNYWWNISKLETSIQHHISDKPIYVGSDCFGRGTFGGGGSNTYKAVHAIHNTDQKKGKLAPALFAIGHTYQIQGHHSHQWKLNQKAMYRGMNFNKTQISSENWQYIQSHINGQSWKNEGDWAVTSFLPCKRVFARKLNTLLSKSQQNLSGEISIHFQACVAGTGPNFEDPYKITLKILLGTDILIQQTTGQAFSKQQEQMISLSLSIDAELPINQIVVTVVEQGHDAEKWGGHYGVRFKDENIHVVTYARQNDWVSRVKVNSEGGIKLPYLNYYNLGHGNFHIFGKKINKPYDFLSDNDSIYPYLFNPPSNLHISFQEAYLGGSSLNLMGNGQVKIAEVNLQKWTNFICRVTLKGCEQGIKLFGRLGQEKYQGTLLRAKQIGNGWFSETFNFCIKEEITQTSKFILFMQPKSNPKNYFLGQTAVYIPDQQKVVPKIKKMVICLSEQNPPICPIFFKVAIQMDRECRILIRFGEQFCCFGWADQFNQNQVRIHNLYAAQKEKLTACLKIYALGPQMEFEEIYSCPIEEQKLALQQKIELVVDI